jgi:hypothetical protein
VNKGLFQRILNAFFAIATIGYNGLAVSLPLNGLTSSEIANQFKIYFIPADYAFAIWGLIYIGWLAFAVYQLLPSQRDNPRMRNIGYLFAVSSIANMTWLTLWHYAYFRLTIVVMIVMLAALITIYLRLNIGKAPATRLERWCVDVPFSVNLAWIAVAMISNVSSVLYSVQWDGWGISPEAWFIALLAMTVAIAFLVSLTRGDAAFVLVLIWAYIGVLTKHAATQVVTTAAIVAIACAVLAVVAGYAAALRLRSGKLRGLRA